MVATHKEDGDQDGRREPDLVLHQMREHSLFLRTDSAAEVVASLPELPGNRDQRWLKAPRSRRIMMSTIRHTSRRPIDAYRDNL